MPTNNVVDIRDRLAITPPNRVWMTPEDVFELARLRQLETDLHTSVSDVLDELTRLRHLAVAVLPALKKVAKHRQLGYDHIKVGAFDQALKMLGLNDTKETP